MNHKKVLTLMIINYINRILDQKKPIIVDKEEDVAIAAGKLLLLITKSLFNKK